MSEKPKEHNMGGIHNTLYCRTCNVVEKEELYTPSNIITKKRFTFDRGLIYDCEYNKMHCSVIPDLPSKNRITIEYENKTFVINNMFELCQILEQWKNHIDTKLHLNSQLDKFFGLV